MTLHAGTAFKNRSYVAANIDEVAGLGGGKPLPKSRINATPYVCCDPRTIPVREWVYGNYWMRDQVGLVIAPGGVGKTTLVVGSALALATGRPLMGVPIEGGPKRVWIWNLEDSRNELRKTVEAYRLHHGFSGSDLGDRLYLDSGVSGTGLCIASQSRDGFTIDTELVENITQELIRRKIDLFVIDPFISSHKVSENDNGAIDAISKQWAKIASQAKCSVVLVHHTSKLGKGEASAEKARGASSLVGTARSVITVNQMSEDEAKRCGISGEASRKYIRVYDDKNNRAPAAEHPDWFEIVSVSLGNGLNGGDSIGIAVPCSFPSATASVNIADLARVQRIIGQGDYKESVSANAWVGYPIAEALGLDPEDDKAKIKALIKQWTKQGYLKVVQRRCKIRRENKPHIDVGKLVEEASA